jgi:hypothetical protein
VPFQYFSIDHIATRINPDSNLDLSCDLSGFGDWWLSISTLDFTLPFTIFGNVMGQICDRCEPAVRLDSSHSIAHIRMLLYANLA